MVLADRVNLEFDTPSSLPNLGVYKVGLHLLQILFAFITLCLTASIIIIESRYLGDSKDAPNYTLVVSLASMFVAAALAYFPWSRFNRGFVRLRRFFLRPRTTLIFTCFLTLGWFGAMISMTVHSTDKSSCAMDENWLNKDTSYASAWVEQCNCAKAAAAFSWFSFFAWLATATCSAILLWHEKKLRFAEPRSRHDSVKGDDNQTAISNISNKYDEDARTIIDMHYSEKDKLPVANYENTVNDDSHQFEEHVSLANTTVYASSVPPISAEVQPAPSAPPLVNSGDEFVSSFASDVKQPYRTPTVATAMPSPYIPSNLVSPYIPQANVQAPVTSPSPYPTPSPLYIVNSPYNNNNVSPYQKGLPPFIPTHSSPYPQHQQQYRGTPQFTANNNITAPYPNTPTGAQHQYGVTDIIYQPPSPTGYHEPVVHQYQQQAIPYKNNPQQCPY